MNIFLVRHGEAAASWGDSPDPGLSTLGWRQARETALLLRPLVSHDTLILSSPLLRARQTAEPLSHQLATEVRLAEAFREIPAPVPLAQRQVWLRQFMQQEWGGQREELVTWRTAVIQRLIGLDRTAVVFTHFLVINAVVGHLLDHARTLSFWPANGSVTRLRHTGSRLELIELGQEIESIVN